MHLISIRISEPQLQKIDDLASQLATSRAQIIRYLIEGHFNKMQPLKLTKDERSSLLKLWQKAVKELGQLSTNCSQLCSLNRKLGNNVNQVAHDHNSGKFISQSRKKAASRIISLLLAKNSSLDAQITNIWNDLEADHYGIYQNHENQIRQKSNRLCP